MDWYITVLYISSFGSLIWSFKLNGFNETNLQTIPCITKILQKYFTMGEPLTGSALLVNIDDSFSLFQEHLLQILNNNNELGWTVIIQNHKVKRSATYALPDKVKSYLLFFNYANDAEEVIEDWKSLSAWNPLAQMVILFSAAQHPILIESNMDILVQLLLRNKVFNANIVSEILLQDIVQVYTLYPYESNSCLDESKNIKLVESCEFDNSEDFYFTEDNVINMTEFHNVENGRFPKDFHGCPLKARAKMWEPYTIYDEKQGFVAGIDVMLVRTIAESLNMSAEIMLQNTSTYQVYQQLIEYEIDMIIGGVSEDPGLSHLLSASFPYFQDDMTWCVHKAGRLLKWNSFLTLFDTLTWCLIIAVLFITPVLVFSLNALSQNNTNFFLTFLSIGGLFCSQSFTYAIKKLSVRMLFIFIFIFTLIINTAYQSFLISSLTHPKTNFQVSTTQHIVDNGMHITGEIDIVQHLNKKGKIYDYLLRKISICENMENCVQAVINDAKLAIAISRENVFYNPNIPRDEIFCFSQSENIYSYLVSILVPKNFHLLEKINNIIQQMIESGHIVKWTRELNNNITLKEEIKKNRKANDILLKTEQLLGPFILWGICMTIALFVFVLEIVIHRVAMSSKLVFWMKLDNAFYSGNPKTKVRRIKGINARKMESIPSTSETTFYIE